MLVQRPLRIRVFNFALHDGLRDVQVYRWVELSGHLLCFHRGSLWLVGHLVTVHHTVGDRWVTREHTWNRMGDWTRTQIVVVLVCEVKAWESWGCTTSHVEQLVLRSCVACSGRRGPHLSLLFCDVAKINPNPTALCKPPGVPYMVLGHQIILIDAHLI